MIVVIMLAFLAGYAIGLLSRNEPNRPSHNSDGWDNPAWP